MFIEQDVFTSFEFWSFDSNKNFNKSYFLFWDGCKGSSALLFYLDLFYCFDDRLLLGSPGYVIVLVIGFCHIAQVDLNSCSFCLSFHRAGIAGFHWA